MSLSTPLVTELRVVPVAGRDSMLLNLSGAHGPFFTRNLLILSDNAGRTGVGEVPGGEKIRTTLEEAAALVVGQPVADGQRILGEVRRRFADRDAGGRGLQTFDLRVRRQSDTATELAAWLAQRPDVGAVIHPSRPDHPQHELAGRLLRDGLRGAMVTFVLDDDERALAVMRSLRVAAEATSLGGVESTFERRRRWRTEPATIPDGLVRLSVGIEDVDDLCDDLATALDDLR